MKNWDIGGDNLKLVGNAYTYGIAGTPYKVNHENNGLIGFGNSNNKHSDPKGILSQDPLTNYAVLGDSGSPLFVYDREKENGFFLGLMIFGRVITKNLGRNGIFINLNLQKLF